MNPILLAPAFLLLSVALHAAPAMEQLDRLAPPGHERPNPEPPRPVEIAVYETEEEFTFESDAKAELENRLAAFRAAGITTLGGRTTLKANRRYGFAVEYLPALPAGAATPPALLLRTYRSPASYWRESDAEQAMESAAANLRTAGLAVAASGLVKVGRDNSYEVSYFAPNLLRPGRSDDVFLDKFASGKFSFESQAEAAAEEAAGRLRAAGIPVLRTGSVRRPDRDYSAVVEFALRTNRFGARPKFAPASYQARASFTFESGAETAARESLAAFSAAGVFPINGYVRKAGRDYSYGVDFLVEQIYRGPDATPAVSVKTYQAQENFDFESEAEAALAQKTAAFEAAGLKVIGSQVIPAGRDYTFVLDYLAR